MANYAEYKCGSTSILALPEIWNPHSSQSAGLPSEGPTQFRCVAVSEDPEQIYPIESHAWAAQNRFKIRPNTAFAALRSPNDPASIWFTNLWPTQGGAPSIPNELASSRGFWPDIYNNNWLTPPAASDIYAVQCYPFYKLPTGAALQTLVSIPPSTFHVDRYYQGVSGTPSCSRFFAMGEKNSALQTVPFGGTTIEVDIRGTELLFQIPDRTLFREPTTLCKLAHPVGSQLRTGPAHWLNGPGYRGKTRGSIPEAGTAKPGMEADKWVGFSLGERPTAWIMAAKLVDASKADIPADQYGWDPARGHRETTEYMGSFNLMASPPASPSVIQGTGNGWYTPTLYPKAEVSLWRFFQVPANTVNIQSTLLTVRLQYQHPISSKWITYDERYLQCEGDFTSRFDYRHSNADPDGSGKG